MTLPTDQSKVEIEQFVGLMTAIDPHDMPPGGSTEQVNVTNVTAGELSTRRGMKQVSFED